MIGEYKTQVEFFSKIKPQTILEIGVLDGEYSKELHAHFNTQQEDIYLVEPNPDLRESLEGAFPRANKIYKAISENAGYLQFNKVVSTKLAKVGSSSLAERIDGWNNNLRYDTVAVEAITGHTLMTKINRDIDLCIVDVEGLAYEVLNSFGDKLSSIKSLMVECEHAEIFKGQHLYEEVSELLIKNNFRLMAFKYSYANQSDSIWIREDCVDLGYKHWPIPD